MSVRTVVDTNILVYAHDLDAGEKNALAKEIVFDFWNSRTGILRTYLNSRLVTASARFSPTPA